MKYLIIIPARSGSRRIKNKNIVNICGEPLIAYTIKPSLKLKKEEIVHDVILSTDSVMYANIGKSLGVDIPFIRPKKISREDSNSIDFMLHAIRFLERKGKVYDATILLQPTSPLRKYEDIKKAIRIFERYENNSLISAFIQKDYINTNVYRMDKGFGLPINPLHNKDSKERGYRQVYIRNGAIYITKVSFLKKYRKIYCDRPLVFCMPKKRSLDLDTIEQLKSLRSYIQHEQIGD